jgi:hypothetical protein
MDNAGKLSEQFNRWRVQVGDGSHDPGEVVVRQAGAGELGLLFERLDALVKGREVGGAGRKSSPFGRPRPAVYDGVAGQEGGGGQRDQERAAARQRRRLHLLP